MNPLTSDVVRGMVSASTQLKHANVSMGVYEEAKNRGDSATMERALGYASDSMNEAADASREAGEALAAAQADAAVEEKANAQETQPMKPAAGETAAAKPGEAGVESSEPALEGAQGNGAQDAAKAAKAASEVKMYTSTGRPRQIPAEPRISVTV